MAKKDGKSLTTDSTDGTDAEGVIDMRGVAAPWSLDTEGKKVLVSADDDADGGVDGRYDRYYCSALSGALAFYGVNRTKLAVLDDMAHRMAMQSLASEGMRRREAEGIMNGEELTTDSTDLHG